MNYTKGEWEVIEYPVQGHFIGNGEVTIATIHEGVEEAEANAHLMAAAPEMYEALEAVDAYLSAPYPDNMKLKQIAANLLVSALAKAEGGKQ